MISVSVWSLFQGLSFVYSDFNIKLLLANLRYLGIETAPISFFALSYEYQNGAKSFDIKKWTLSLIFPLINFMAVCTNNYHHLFYIKVSMENNILLLDNGPLFWINMYYLYIFIVIGVFIFIKASIKSVSLYRKQSFLIASGALIPILANLAFNFNLLPFKNIDITPFSLLLSGILYFYALLQYKLLDIIPIARDRLLEQLQEVVIVLDMNRRILDLNKKAREVLLRNNDIGTSLIGMGIESLLKDWDELLQLINNPEGENKKIIHHQESCTEYYDVRISDVFDSKGNKSGELLVLRDITELENALLEAKNAKIEAEAANTAKGFFLANMSHEIRTPMNAVIGISDILTTTELPREKQKSYIEMMSSSAQLLLTIINDILDFSKIEAGKMEIEKQPFKINKLIKECTDSLSITAADKSLILKTEIDEGLNNFLLGDSVRIKQILTNLISNSIKFTKEGEIKVSAKKINEEVCPVQIQLQVSDTGIGIPAEKLGTIFESFKQVDSSTTRKFGGTGLGLSIVKNLVELMGGKITVQSELGKGSNFCIDLSFEAALNTAEYEDENSTQKEVSMSLPGLKILVADDNKINREIINIYLTKMQCSIDFAENGAVALEKLKLNKYDLVLMDVQMPELDGWKATEIIRNEEKTTKRHIPIIALTAGVMREDINKCFDAGMDAHLSKPIKITNLYNTLKTLIIN